MWYWSIFKSLSDSLIKPKKIACSVKSGKSRPVLKNTKSWFQRILVTEHLWKTWSVVSASVWEEGHKGDWFLSNWKKLLVQIKYIINGFITETT